MARNHVILKFLLLSAAVHTFALASWPTREPPVTRISAVLSVGFAALEPAATSPASAPASLAKAKSPQPPTTAIITSKTKSAPIVTPQRAPAKRHDSQRLTSSAVSTTAMRSTPLIAKTDQTQQESEAPRTLVRHSAPEVARPWEPTRASVRHHPADEQIRTANTAAALLRIQAQQLTSAAGAASPANTSEAMRTLIRSHLETDLSRYFSYPRIARQRGWQGHVRVAFTVQADGELTDAHITHSSGYHVLDASALEALRRVGRLSQAREWLHGQTLTMELPVIYRLEN